MTTPDEWRSRGEIWQWRGYDVYVRVEGRGEPLLAIHGFPTASWDWHAIWPALVDRFRVLTLDMMGFGFTAKPRDFAYSIVAQADLFEALLAREGVTRYRILAHDYGTSVAQELLARQGETKPPARIESVCLLNGGIFPERHRAAVTQKLLLSRLGPLVSRLSSYRTFARTMTSIWGTQPPPESELRGMWQLVTANAGMRVMPDIIRYIAERKSRRDRWVGALINARVPLRFVCGLVDPVSGEHMAARYRELVPRPDVVDLPGVGHYPQVEAPAAVTDALFAHVASATVQTAG
jgi:pimeloyl-ACP methyl ester carboxylesterase